MFNFVPRGLQARRKWGFEARREGFQGTAAGVSRQGEVGFRGAATLIELLSALSFPAVPRGPIWGFEGRRWLNPTSPCLETPPAVPRNPFYHASKPHLRRASRSLGTKSGPKIFKFRWFLGPSEQNELYHIPLQSKIRDLSDRICFGGGSL